MRVPAVFLLDEPLTHLEAPERIRLRTELASLQHGLGVTALYHEVRCADVKLGSGEWNLAHERHAPGEALIGSDPPAHGLQ